MRSLSFLSSIVLSWCIAISPVLANDDVKADGFNDAANAFKDGDFVKATSMFKILAENGNATAQYNYASLTYEGLGIPVDFEEAWFWAWRARLAGIEKAIKLTENIKGELSQDSEIALVERLNETYENFAFDGDVQAISDVAIINYLALTEPDLEKSYTWALVAQAFGQTDVQSIISESSEILEIDKKISNQKKARELFNKIKK